MVDLKKKNILFLCSWYPSRVLPTSGNFIQKHARCLIHDTNIFILHVCEDDEMKSRVEYEFGEIEGVQHLIVYFRPRLKVLKPFYKFQAYFFGFKKLQERFNPIDLIHLNVIMDAGFYLWFRSFLISTPFVVTEHAAVYLKRNWYRLSAFRKFLIRKAIQKSDMILPVSHNLKMNMKAFGMRSEFEVVPNIVNTELFKLKNTNIKKDKIKFLHISAFDFFKNVSGILRVVKRLSKIRSDFILTIAGDGDLGALKNYANKLAIPSEFIQFIGRMTETEVSEVMRNHDAFVLFSNSENLPVVLIEAQSCGLPIISTLIGGTGEIITDKKYGVLISPKDEDALEREMIKMIENYEKYEPLEIRKRAISLYSEPVIKNQILNIYTKVLGT